MCAFLNTLYLIARLAHKPSKMMFAFLRGLACGCGRQHCSIKGQVLPILLAAKYGFVQCEEEMAENGQRCQSWDVISGVVT